MVFGVALDSVESHRKFCDSLALPFQLLTDDQGRAAREFGVFVENYGGIAKRSLFLVESDGRLGHVDGAYDLKHGDDWQALLEALGKKPEVLPAARALVDAPTALTPELLDGEAIRRDLKQLASDEFEGRGVGTRAERKSIEFLTEQLVAAGWSPGNGPSFVQPVPLLSVTKETPPQLAVGGLSQRFLDDFVLMTRRQKTPKLEVGGELVFVGYGCRAPEFGWDDYAGLDVKGKVVVCLINDPPVTDGRFGGKAMTYYGRWTYKYEEAAAQGAAGCLIVHETEPAAYPWEVVRNSWGGEQFDFGRADGGESRCAFEGWITREVAVDLLRRSGAGLEFETLKAAAGQDGFKAITLGMPATAKLDNRFTPIVSHNVIAILPGCDPRASHEHVVMTAHWDHFGIDPTKSGDTILNGAVDNASGCAGLLEMVRALGRGPRARRSVVALFVTAEERGLLGSQWYAEKPVFPLAEAMALVNLDGINVWGRTRDLSVVGMGQTSLEPLLSEALAAQGRVLAPDPEPEKGSYYRSDQLPFARAGVPALYTGKGIEFVGQGSEYGLEIRRLYTAERYHKPSDEFDPAWNFDGAVDDLRALLSVVRRTLAQTEWPQWNPTSEFKALRPDAGPARAAGG
ncbi:MAG: M28 family peptidase [Planctomycetes bacterium]|nr:M28 family peptidase [Planctomycetota bacterium]